MNEYAFFAVFRNLDLLKYITSFQKGKKWYSIVDGNWVCKNNFMSLLETKKDLYIDSDAMDGAAKRGNLKIIQWLHNNRSEGCTTKAVNIASLYGHFDVVQWLLENRKEGCTRDAMNNAASNGHLNIVKYLHFKGKTCTKQAMDNAASNGHLEVLIWLNNNRKEGFTKNAFHNAVEGGHTPVVQWLLANYPLFCSDYAIRYCTTIDTLEFILQYEPSWSRNIDLSCAITNPYTVEWLVKNNKIACNDRLLLLSIEFAPLWLTKIIYAKSNKPTLTIRKIKYNNVETLEWLHSKKLVSLTDNVLNTEAQRGDLETFMWIATHSPFLISTKTIQAAASSSHLHIVDWLYKTQSVKCTFYTLKCAIYNQDLKLVNWICENEPSLCLKSTITSILENADVKVIKWMFINKRELCNEEDLWNLINENIGKSVYCADLETIQWAKNNGVIFPILNLHHQKYKFLLPRLNMTCVKWLNQIGIEIYNDFFLVLALKLKNVEIVKWLCEHTKAKVDQKQMKTLGSRKRSTIAQYFNTSIKKRKITSSTSL